jgi:peptidoglycan/LPS O-acetylase OafA/YrhL
MRDKPSAAKRSSPPTQRTRLAGLDFIRAIAVLLVLIRHLSVAQPEGGGVLRHITSVLARGGWIGVDLFFVLSGFLVAGLLFSEHRATGRAAVGRFLVRRGFKIYPSFYLLILFTLAVDRWNLAWPNPRRLAAELAFLQNYLPGLWNHTWSLAVEEHFYLLLALSVAISLHTTRSSASRAPFRALPCLFVATATACLLLRLYLRLGMPFDELKHLYPTHLRIDALLFGVVLSYYHHYRPESFHRLAGVNRCVLGLAGLVLCAPAFALPIESSIWMNTVGLTALFVGAGLILVAMHDLWAEVPLLVRPIAYVGARSYSLYLWHMPVLVYLVPTLTLKAGLVGNWPATITLALAGTLAVGIVAANATEIPVLALRDRIMPPVGQHATGSRAQPFGTG